MSLSVLVHALQNVVLCESSVIRCRCICSKFSRKQRFLDFVERAVTKQLSGSPKLENLLGSSNVDVSFGSTGRDALDDLGEVLLDEVDVSMEAGLVALVTYRIQDVKDVHPRIE